MYLIRSLISKIEICSIVFNKGASKALSINTNISTCVIAQKIELIILKNRKIVLNILYIRLAATKQ